MRKKPINQVVAEALKFYMGTRWNNSTLGQAAGVSPNTVKNYLAPQERAAGTSGKEPSAKLTELDKLAVALGVTVADLVTDAPDDERARLHRRRAAEYYEATGRLPDWAPTAAPPTPPEVSPLKKAS